MKRLVLGALVLAVAIAAAAYLYNSSQTIVEGGVIYRKTKDYNPPEEGKSSCAAISPECGVCYPGILKGDTCYIKQ